MMDPFTRKVLRDFWKKVDDNEGVTNKGFYDLEEANNNDEHEITEIFKIETNLFNYETPLCTEFKEFNYLLKVDTKLFTHDIERTKTYEDYKSELNKEVGEPRSKDGVPYEKCDHICEPFRFKNGKTKWPTCNSNEDRFYNGGDLKEEALKQKAIYENHGVMQVKIPYANYYNNAHGEEEQEDKERCNLFNDTAQRPPIFNIKRFEMIKYSFGQGEEYVAIKEYEYNDLTRTSDDACHAYQEIFHNMDEGWLVTRAE
ncbi:hypothetical protein Tco_0871437 [Tanacetum coccineum]